MSGKSPDVEIGEGLQLLGRGVARLYPLPGVQLPEQRMNLFVVKFCAGGGSRYLRGRHFGLALFAVLADRGLHDKAAPGLHR